MWSATARSCRSAGGGSCPGAASTDLERGGNLNYVVRLTRRDLDWRLSIETVFDVVSENTSINLLFEPSFGGLFSGRNADWFDTVHFGANDYTSY